MFKYNIISLIPIMLPMAQTPIASKSAPLSVWDFHAIFPLRYKMAEKQLLSKHFYYCCSNFRYGVKAKAFHQ